MRPSGPPAIGLGDGGVIGAPVALEGQAESPQQHGDVGALGAVVGVELVEHQVLQAGR